MSSLKDKAKCRVTKTIHPKCPRCYRHTPEGHYNFDSLCDRCCGVLVDKFPNHPSVSFIKAAHKAYREMTPQQRRILNHKISPEDWPLSDEDVECMQETGNG